MSLFNELEQMDIVDLVIYAREKFEKLQNQNVDKNTYKNTQKALKSCEKILFEKILLRFLKIAPRLMHRAKKNIVVFNDDKEDIVQTALIIIWEKYKTENFTNSFSAWSYGVLKNTVRDYYKNENRSIRTLKEDIQNIYEEGISGLDLHDNIGTSNNKLERIVLKKVDNYFEKKWVEKNTLHNRIQESKKEILNSINSIVNVITKEEFQGRKLSKKTNNLIRRSIMNFFKNNPLPNEDMISLDSIVNSNLSNKNHRSEPKFLKICILKALKQLKNNCNKIMEIIIEEYMNLSSLPKKGSDTTRSSQEQREQIDINDVDIRRIIAIELGWDIDDDNQDIAFSQRVRYCREKFQELLVKYNCLDRKGRKFI